MSMQCRPTTHRKVRAVDSLAALDIVHARSQQRVPLKQYSTKSNSCSADQTLAAAGQLTRQGDRCCSLGKCTQQLHSRTLSNLVFSL